MCDLSSLTRVQTYTLCSGWAESQALDSWGSLHFSPIFNLPPSLPSFLSFSTQHELSMNYSDFTFTFLFHALEKEMATHSSVLAWRIPGTGEPGRLPSMGSHRVRHD